MTPARYQIDGPDEELLESYSRTAASLEPDRAIYWLRTRARPNAFRRLLHWLRGRHAAR